MKKLLTLLLIISTSISFGQDLVLDHSFVESTPHSVGDIITIKFNTLDVANSTPTFVQFDYQYNNKLLEKISHTFILSNNPSALTALNHWDGYSWNPSGNVPSNNLSGQFQQGSYQGSVTDWSVERITVQDGSAIAHAGTILEVKFRVKDKINTNYSDYSEVTKLNWANIKDNSTSTTYDVDAMTDVIDLGQVNGGVLSAVTLSVNTPVTSKSDYIYTIFKTSDNSQVTSGNFDASGDATITGLVDGVDYDVLVTVPHTASWLDDVVTVSDVYLVFNYMSSTDIDGNGTGTFDYYLQKVFGNVTSDNTVNDQDSYTLLAHLSGTLPTYVPNDQSTFFPITSTEFGAMNYSMLLSQYGKETISTTPQRITPSPSLTTFSFGHGLNGDVDLSHSYTPSTSGFNTAAKSVSLGKVRNTNFSKVPENSNLDITTQLVDGKVVLEISTIKTGMAGAQINLNYDTSRLEFSEVVFDSGNTMTNFANEKNGKIFIGSLDLKGENTVKTGTPYKVIFTPKETLTNTAGLVSFGVTEGVKTDGTKVKFNIQ